jgi:thioredoxin-related protein
MKKQIAGILLLGILIAFGCSRPPVVNSAPVDLNAALAQAKAQNKLVLMEFTGSDWCPPCMKLQKEIFSRSAFQAYAQSNLVFLTLISRMNSSCRPPPERPTLFSPKNLMSKGIPP